MLVDILSRSSQVSIQFAENNSRLERGHVLIIPPGFDAIIRRNRIELIERKGNRWPSPNIDRILKSAAEEFGEKAVGIILSGSGSDGAKGIEAILKNHGVGVVQDFESAKFSSMPQAAKKIATEVFSASPDEVAEMINLDTPVPTAKIYENDSHSLADVFDGDEKEKLQFFFNEFKANFQIDFRFYKNSTLKRRLENFYFSEGIPGLNELYDIVQRDKGVLESLKDCFLISVTSFFRDPEHFLMLEQTLREKMKSQDDVRRVLRVWVVACSTGQEAYTIALILEKLITEFDRKFDYKIFATDVSQSAISKGRKGRYDRAGLKEIPAGYADAFVHKDGHTFQFKKYIREKIVFSIHNILEDPPFIDIDLLTCRNFLIYIGQKYQKIAFNKFSFSLRSSGYLFLGKSENLKERNRDLKEINSSSKIYEKLGEGGLASFSPMVKPRYFENPSLSNLEKNATRARAKNDFNDYIFSQFTPDGVVINSTWEVVEILGNINPYLEIGPGPLNQNFLKMLKKDFHTEAIVLMNKLKTKIKKQVSKKVFEVNDNLVRIALFRLPTDLNKNSNNILFTFEKLSFVKRNLEEFPGDKNEAQYSQHILSLENDLKNTKSYLDDVLEEVESSNEELQAMNEELQAANEELQASNEELESTNEELIASNDELNCVNQELALKSSEYEDQSIELKSIVDHLAFPVFLLDSHLNLQSFNFLAEEHFPVVNQGKNRPWSSINLPEALLDLEGHLGACLEGPDIVEVTVEFDDRAYLTRMNSYENTMGKIDGVILTLIDQTDIMTIKNRLESSEGLMSSFLENAESVVTIKDLSGTYSLVNPKFCEVFGETKKSAQGSTPFDILPQKVASKIQKTDIEVMQLKKKIIEKIELPTVKGLKLFLSHRFPVYSHSQKLKGVGNVMVDVSSLEEASDTIEKQKNIISQTSKLSLLGELSAGIAHELNTPLATLHAEVHLLKRHLKKNEVDIKRIEKTADRFDYFVSKMSDIIKTLRRFSWGDSQKTF
jgi:two-component system CheB/CheR fusion protein